MQPHLTQEQINEIHHKNTIKYIEKYGLAGWCSSSDKNIPPQTNEMKIYVSYNQLVL